MGISIITVSYNSAATIENTIKSVLPQLKKEDEYVVIDGKSSDGTIDIVKKYTGIRWVSERDNGISDAFNKGIRMADNDIIGIINSDDELLPGALEIVRNEFDDDVDVLYGNGIKWGDGVKKFRYISDRDTASLYDRMSILHPATFVKKAAYEKYGMFDVDLKCVMDRELLLRMLTKGARFKYVNCDLALYKLGGESYKMALRHTIPESEMISIKYGKSRIGARLFSIKSYINFSISKYLQKHEFADSAVRGIIGKKRDRNI